MDCLLDYIGLKGCNEQVPESGLYINTLPGISIQAIDSTADSEQVTYKQVWADAQVEASERFSLDFFDELMKCYQVKPYCDYEALICSNKKVLSSAWRYLLGNQLMLFRLYTSRLNYFTTVSLTDAEKLRDLYQVEYEKSLSKAVKLVDANACCLQCGGDPQVVIYMP